VLSDRILLRLRAPARDLPSIDPPTWPARPPATSSSPHKRRANPAAPWPKSLRVKDVEGAPGIWELTWSFAGPDGRATFEWITIDGEQAVRRRRVGGHEIFDDPAR
jgi:hypothetical protein